MSDSSKIEPIVETMPLPPRPGAPLAEVVRYYTETARLHVPDWDIELIPIAGKNPQINGTGWQTLASSDARHVLDQTKAAGGGVTGYGALMNRHIAFDVDHPEFLPPALASIFEEGLKNHSRPGRTHYIFRVPDGKRFGGSQTKMNEAFGVLGKWGEIKAWNSQIRIWSPNTDDGTHVALVPGSIPDLPFVLLGLLAPPLGDGEMVSAGELDDWLDEHTESSNMAFLGGDIAKLELRAASMSKYEAMNGLILHMSGNVAAGFYPGRTAYDALLVAYMELCESDGDWDGQRVGKYRDSWRGAAAKFSRDPVLIAQTAERRAKYAGVGELTDDEHDLFAQMAEAFGVSYPSRDVPARRDIDEISDDDLQRLLSAPSAREEGQMAEDTSVSPERDLGPVPAAELPVEAEPADSETIHWAIDLMVARTVALRQEAAEMPPGADRLNANRAYERMRALSDQLVMLPEELQERWIKNILSKTPEAMNQLLEDLTRAQSQSEARDLLREVRMSAVGTPVEPVGLELTWRKIVPPDTLRRTDGIGLLNSSDKDGHGVFHNLVGGKGAGKSTLAMYAAIEILNDGGIVAWVDFEQGPDPVANMLMTLGAPACAGDAARFAYIDMKTNSGAMLSDALKAVSALPNVPNLIIVDSLSRAIVRVPDVADGAENSSQALISLVDSFVNRLTSAGSSVLMISHTGHGDNTRARGTSAIAQQVDVEYSIDVLVGWSRETEGATLVTTRKARFGFHDPDEPAAVVTYRPDLSVEDELRRPMTVTLLPPTDTAAMAWRAAAEEDKSKAREAKRAAALEDKKATVESSVRDVISCLAEGERKTTNAMWDEVKLLMSGSRKQDVAACLKALLAAGEVVMDEDGQAMMWGRK